ncbi:MAG: hypothetical protein ACYSR4_03310 [Planctomycetota bacterium]|jgi:hypothetical protein
MAEFEEASGYCTHCQKQVLIRRKGTNHVLHLLLTLVTGGLWLIVWILCAIKIGGWRCVQCGSNAGRFRRK